MSCPKCKKVRSYGAGVTMFWTPSENTHTVDWVNDDKRKKVRRVSHKEAEAIAIDVAHQLLVSPGATQSTASTLKLADAARAFVEQEQVERGWSSTYVKRQMGLIGHLDGVTLAEWDIPTTRRIMRSAGGASSQSQMLTLLRQTHLWAVEHKKMPENSSPTTNVRVTAKKPGKKESPTIEHVERLAIEAEKLRPGAGLAIRLCAYCGLRISEMLALEFEDARDGGLHVDRQVDVEKKGDPPIYNADGNLTHWTTDHGFVTLPKRGKRRKTILPRVLADQMAGRSGPILLSSRGRYLTDSNWNKTTFYRAYDAAKLPRRDNGARLWTTHDLRHHAAQWMLEELGLLPHQVAVLLGHADASITMRMYVTGRDDTASIATSMTESWKPPRV